MTDPNKIVDEVVEAGIVEEAAARGPEVAVIAGVVAFVMALGAGAVLLWKKVRSKLTNEDQEAVEYVEQK